MNLVVYTALYGADARDILRVPARDAIRPGVRYVAFTDLRTVPAPWVRQEPVQAFPDGRKTSRYHKINASAAFPTADVTLWHDASFQLLVDPRKMVEAWLQQGDLTVFRHRFRNCLYQEAIACQRCGKATEEELTRQTDEYRFYGYPENHGLHETGVIVRRRTAAIRRVEEAWWNEVSRHSLRDQISFDFVLWQLGMRAGQVPHTCETSPWLRFFCHNKSAVPKTGRFRPPVRAPLLRKRRR